MDMSSFLQYPLGPHPRRRLGRRVQSPPVTLARVLPVYSARRLLRRRSRRGRGVSVLGASAEHRGAGGGGGGERE